MWDYSLKKEKGKIDAEKKEMEKEYIIDAEKKKKII